ncbi:hypothetical protein ZIOFF_016714 [Zingiber officinale]|uniref:FAR1 domain-containing protein n=1 Tax=Zingiber officinale TaxID=94328 RepID=A0A8J5I1Y0_ZINOF|nr:hypothetical protein ZIOFF_016714 [Zingiber officinale]
MEQELLIDGDLQVLGDSSSSYTVDTPQVGMYFSYEEVHDFYKSYAQGLGFGISKLGSKKGDDDQLKYFSFECSKNGCGGASRLHWGWRRFTSGCGIRVWSVVEELCGFAGSVVTSLVVVALGFGRLWRSFASGGSLLHAPVEVPRP